MNIELRGLTDKQVALCDIMRAIETKEGVESFISTLPIHDQQECRNLIEMMRLAILDEVDSVDEAQEVLENIKGTK